MRQAAMERRIRELQRRIKAARAELAILDEQLEVLTEDAEDARVRWLVAETPLSERESADAQRTLSLATRAATTFQAEIDRCIAERDRLLFELPAVSRK